MKEVIASCLNLGFRLGLLAVLLSTYFLFSNLTTEFYDTPKFIILLIFVGLMLILTTARYALEGKVTFVRTPFDLPLVLLLAVGVVSTFLSPSPFVATLGHQLRIHGSLISLTVYVLFYFVLTQNLRSQRGVLEVLNVCIWGGVALSVITLTSYFGIKLLPDPWSLATNFTPTGSSFSTAAILAMLLPILVSRILTSQNLILLTVNSLLLTLFGITIALTGGFSTWIGASAGFLLTILILNPVKERDLENIISKPPVIAGFIALAVVVTTAVISFIPPVGNAQNPLYSAAKNFPRELQLPFITSWKISVSTFRDSPFWGSGPSSFLFNFTTYKPIEFNATNFWNIRFDSAFNEYLQTLATLGGVGLLALISLTLLFVSKLSPSMRGEPQSVALAGSGIVFFVILMLHPSTLPIFVLGLLFFACFWLASRSEVVNKGETQSLPWVRNLSQYFEQTIKVEALPSILLIISVVLVLFALFFGGKFVLADWHHRKALSAIAQNNGVLAYNELIASEKLNPYNDLYRTDIAQVNFALANAIAQAKGPTEDAPEGTLTDQDKQNIQTLLQQSISEGRTAAALSPRSAINQEVLALLYRQIAGVAQNALLFSLDSYGRAIINDPFNPQLRLNVGGVYYAVQNYDLAIRFFTDAINLKPDFANGFYNLSVALRDKGDLNGAITAAERTLALVTQGSSDFEIANNYLNELKAKAGGPAQPPAAETTGALQEEKLPNVVDLPKPEKIATPEAIRRSPSPSPKVQREP